MMTTMTKIPNYPRYQRATSFSLNALVKSRIYEFPIDIKKVCKSFGIKLKKYSTLAKKNNLTIDQISEAYKTKLGYIFRNEKGKYFIAYNDSLPEGLIRFTLAHEFGHFFLNHLEDFEETELRYNALVPYSNEHLSLEREANCFARNFLSPAPIAFLIREEVSSMQILFGLTYKASKVRLESMKLDEKNFDYIYKNITDKEVINYLSDVQLKYATLCHCHRCGAEFAGEFVNYCPYCKSEHFESIELEDYSKIKRSGRDSMIYSRIDTNEQGTPLTCPRCGAEELNDEFEYCPWCATYLHNVCLGKEEDKFVNTFDGDVELNIAERYKQNGCSNSFLDGGFRYCPSCGAETSFNEQGLLDNWKSEKKQANDPFSGAKFNELPFLEGR